MNSSRGANRSKIYFIYTTSTDAAPSQNENIITKREYSQSQRRLFALEVETNKDLIILAQEKKRNISALTTTVNTTKTASARSGLLFGTNEGDHAEKKNTLATIYSMHM